MKASDVKKYFTSLEKDYSEEEIQEFMNIVEKIEKENLNCKKTKDLLNGKKVRDINTCFEIAFYKALDNAAAKILVVERYEIKNALIKLRDSIRNNTIREYVSNFNSKDFEFLEVLVYRDHSYINDEQKLLYINELKYLNGEIECAIPKVKVKKKTLPRLEEK